MKVCSSKSESFGSFQGWNPKVKKLFLSDFRSPVYQIEEKKILRLFLGSEVFAFDLPFGHKMRKMIRRQFFLSSD